MGYTVGISSGAFGLVDQKEKQSLMTITRKIFAGGLEGVSFTQVDLESITEFNVCAYRNAYISASSLNEGLFHGMPSKLKTNSCVHCTYK